MQRYSQPIRRDSLSTYVFKATYTNTREYILRVRHSRTHEFTVVHAMHVFVDVGKSGYRKERITSPNDDCPVFSTISLSARVNTGDRQSNGEKYPAVHWIKLLFKHLLDFFYANQISVCFGRIQSRRGCLTNIPALLRNCSTPMQIYALTMLRNARYLVEQKLFAQKDFLQRLLSLTSGDDDKFYRLCLYLFRRSIEYHFLDVSHQGESILAWETIPFSVDF